MIFLILSCSDNPLEAPEDGPLQYIPIDSDYCDFVKYSYDGNQLGAIVGSKIIIWNVNNYSIEQNISNQGNTPNSFDFNYNNTLLAYGGTNSKIYIANNGNTVEEFLYHSDEVVSVVFHPTKNIIASSSKDSTVVIYDLDSKRILKILTGFVAGMGEICFSPDGNQLAVSVFKLQEVEKLFVYNLTNFTKKLFNPETSLVYPMMVRFTPDGSTLAVSTDVMFGSMLFFDVETQEKKSIWGIPALSFCYSKDSKYFIHAIEATSQNLPNGYLDFRTIENNEYIFHKRLFTKNYEYLDFNPTKYEVAVVGHSNKIEIYNVLKVIEGE